MEAVWPGVAVTDDSLVQCIHQIRRALGDDGHAILKTVPKRGYRFVLPTEPETELPIVTANAASTARLPNRLAATALGTLVAVAILACGWWLLSSPAVEAPHDGPPAIA